MIKQESLLNSAKCVPIFAHDLPRYKRKLQNAMNCTRRVCIVRRCLNVRLKYIEGSSSSGAEFGWVCTGLTEIALQRRRLLSLSLSPRLTLRNFDLLISIASTSSQRTGGNKARKFWSRIEVTTLWSVFSSFLTTSSNFEIASCSLLFYTVSSSPMRYWVGSIFPPIASNKSEFSSPAVACRIRYVIVFLAFVFL